MIAIKAVIFLLALVFMVAVTSSALTEAFSKSSIKPGIFMGMVVLAGTICSVLMLIIFYLLF